MDIKTTELTGRALDWAVGVAVGYMSKGGVLLAVKDGSYSPTTNWGQLGPLVEEYSVCISRIGVSYNWGADALTHDHDLRLGGYGGIGDTALIAACRAIVSAKLGDVVDVPEVLCDQ